MPSTRKFSCAAGALALAASVAAQSGPASDSGGFPGLETSHVLGAHHSELGLQLNAFGQPDKVYRTGISFAYGIGRGWEASVAGTIAKESSLQLGNGGDVDFGGSTAELQVKYRIPVPVDASLQAGAGYSHTPAQLDRPVSLLGGSVGWPVNRRVRLYANPKWIALQNNSIVGLTLGAVVDVSRRVHFFADGTSVLTGENAVSSADGSRQRDDLYALGFRFTDVSPGTSVDIGYTNEIGETIGFSLTPSYGDVGGLYLALEHRF